MAALLQGLSIGFDSIILAEAVGVPLSWWLWKRGFSKILT